MTPAASATAAGRQGVLGADERWSGLVALKGDVVVPAGRALVVEAGCRVEAGPRAREALRYPVERHAFGGRLEAPSAARLIVEGTLEVRASAEAPAVFGGDGWGGVVLAGRAQARLSGAVFRSSRDAAVRGLDFSRAVLSACRFESGEDGAAFGGFASAVLRRCRFEGAGRAALRLHDDASVRAAGCAVEGGKFGLALAGCADLWWVGGVVARAGVGAVVAGAARLLASRGRFSSNRVGVSVQERAELDGRALAFTENVAGVETLGASSARLSRLVAVRNDAALWAQNGSSLVAQRSRLDANVVGAKVSHDARAELSESHLAGQRRAGVFVEERGSASLRDCSFEEDENGALVLGDGGVEAERCRFTRCRDTALWLDERARLSETGCVFQSNGADRRRKGA